MTTMGPGAIFSQTEAQAADGQSYQSASDQATQAVVQLGNTLQTLAAGGAAGRFHTQFQSLGQMLQDEGRNNSAVSGFHGDAQHKTATLHVNNDESHASNVGGMIGNLT